MMRRRKPTVTMAEVAGHAGVSIATVSYVLNGTKAVTPEVEGRVRAAANELGYVPSHAAQTLRTGKSWTLGLVLPDLTNPFFPALAQALVEEARAKGYSVILADSRGEERVEADAILNLQQRGVDALLIIPASYVTPPTAEGIPTVLIDRPCGAPLSVQSDKAAGGRLAAEHLLSLGHRNFGILAGPSRNGALGDRVRGMLETLAAAGVTVEPGAFLHSEYSVAAGIQGAEDIIRQPITALLCANDTLALGALAALRRAGHVAGQSISVTGFDDIAWASLSNPALTTVHQNTDELAKVAVDLALKAIADTNYEACLTAPVRLVIRETSGPPLR